MSRGKRNYIFPIRTIPVGDDTYQKAKKLKGKKTWDQWARETLIDRDSKIWDKM